ncbi:MAG: S-adenosylmethionine:tRNA ribosyltransferase-isomerase [Solirubrobacteraceae bacterium]
MTAYAFDVPAALEARQPPEERGLRRDEVRLLVARRSDGSVSHRRFADLVDVLDAGDLLVVNVSATIPAAVSARRPDCERVTVHFATPAPQLADGWWVVELRSSDGGRPLRASVGERISLDGGAELELVAPYASGARLVLARIDGADSVIGYLERHGRPIRYGYVKSPWPLDAYQNVYATTPGSAEMASAGRPFTPELITQLIARGVLFAPITLHCGVSSPERHEAPLPERFEVPEQTAALIRAVREWGGRVVAVGTTVVRALESVAQPDGAVAAGAGWTGLVVTPGRGLWLVDGLITGWHEPEASHLEMLEAAAGPQLLARSYDAALACGYLWHEFGDSHLVLP